MKKIFLFFLTVSLLCLFVTPEAFSMNTSIRKESSSTTVRPNHASMSNTLSESSTRTVTPSKTTINQSKIRSTSGERTTIKNFK